MASREESIHAGLGKPQLRQRSERIPPARIWNDAQLEHSDRREFDVMVFRLAGCALGAEVRLLPHDFTERLPAIAATNARRTLACAQ